MWYVSVLEKFSRGGAEEVKPKISLVEVASTVVHLEEHCILCP